MPNQFIAFPRRQMLRTSALGFGALAAASLLAEASPSAEPGALSLNNPLAARPGHFPMRAKRVIFLFMKGGPSQVDTFDEKPLLARDDGKPLPFAKPRVQFAPTGNLLRSPWKFSRFGQCGMSVSELFPHVAKHVDDLCFIHSLHGTNAAHGGALLKLHTGSDNFVRPSMGAWVTYGLGTENANLPGFVTICPTLAHGGVNNWGSAFLPAWSQGTPLGVASQPANKAAMKYVRSERASASLQRAQLDLAEALNREQLGTASARDELEARIQSFELAFRMQSEMPAVQIYRGKRRQRCRSTASTTP
jgi:hypothetical protein